MDNNDVAVATMTLARNASEEAALRQALPYLLNAGLPIVAADGGSPPAFKEFLQKQGIAVLTPSQSGLVPQVQASIRAAVELGRPYILYTEPDKIPFFDGPLQQFIQRCDSDVEVHFPARSPAAFATFTPHQQTCEGAFNREASQAFGLEADYCYGPILFATKLASLMFDAPADLGWGWRFYFLARAHQEKARLRAHVFDVPCPADQRAEDNADYRQLQLKQNERGLRLGLSAA